MTNLINKHPALAASALGLVLAALPLANSHAATADIPPEILQQLKDLSRKVEQLQKQVDQQKAAPAYHRAEPVAASQSGEVQELKQKVLVLERKQEIAAEDAAEQKKKTPVVVAGDKGFGLKSPDGKFEIKLRGLIQSDARVFDQGIKGLHPYLGDTIAQQTDALKQTHSAADNYVVRRARPTIEGTLGDKFGFKLTTDAGNGQSSLVDGYIDVNLDPAVKIRTGKFTPPVGLERLQSSADTKFNELGLPSNFLPSRDVGVQVSGDVFNKTLNYAVAALDGANDGQSGDNDTNTDKEIAARLFAQPFANHPGFLQGLSFGVGASTTDSRGANGNTGLASYRTSGQENFFSYRNDTSVTNTVFAEGDRTRLVPQFSFYNGSFGLTGEYLNESQEVSRVTGKGNKQHRSEQIDSNAWNVTASYLLTGEDASFKGVKPAHEFDPANGGWGAFELVARAGALSLDEDAFYDSKGVLGGNDSFAQATRSAQAADNTAVGVNWYPNGNLRVSLDYEQTKFDWGGGGTAKNPEDREDERVLIGRVQAAF